MLIINKLKKNHRKNIVLSKIILCLIKNYKLINLNFRKLSSECTEHKHIIQL